MTVAWSCPHLDEEYCHLRKKSCVPAGKGCVLEGRVKLAGMRVKRCGQTLPNEPVQTPWAMTVEDREKSR